MHQTQGMCYHQTRDMATPGFGKPFRDMEKKYPGVVLPTELFGAYVLWTVIFNSSWFNYYLSAILLNYGALALNKLK